MFDQRTTGLPSTSFRPGKPRATTPGDGDRHTGLKPRATTPGDAERRSTELQFRVEGAAENGLRGGGEPAALSACRARFLFLTFTSDWLYPPEQLAQLADTLRQDGKAVTYRCIQSDRGHDAFLVEHEKQAEVIRPFLD
jgi:homoserine acetyltransferase